MITLINILLLLAARFLIKILVIIFKWATEIFFGEMHEAKERRLAIIFIGSLVWCITIAGVFFPDLFILMLKRLPEQLKISYIIRLSVNLIILLMPGFIGFVTVKTTADVTRKNILHTMVSGYKYCVLFGVSFFVMLIYAPIITAIRSIKREVFVHIPMTPKHKTLDETMDTIKNVMEKNWKCKKTKEAVIYRFPRSVFKKVSGEIFGIPPGDKCILAGDWGKIHVNSMDITIEGTKERVYHVQQYLMENLAFEKINLTWSNKANFIEDKALEIYKGYKDNESTAEESIMEFEELLNVINNTNMDFFEIRTLIYNVYLFQREILFEKM